MKKILGLNQDVDPINQPEGTSPYILNGNLTDEYGAVTNERSATSFSVLHHLSQDYVVIGEINLDNSDKVIFVVSPDFLGFGAVVLIRADGSTVWLIEAFLGFYITKLIQGEFKVNNKGHRIIYWTDNFNPPRWLDVDSPNITTLDNLRIFPISNNVTPVINAINNNGNLTSGVYYIGISYLTYPNSIGEYKAFSNPISITNATTKVPPTQYDGCAPDTATNKAIEITIPHDFKNNYFKIGILYKNNGVILAYESDPIILNNPSDTKYIISSLTNFNSVASAASLLVTKAFYDTAKTIAQLEDVLYLANLKDFSYMPLQPYVNGIVVDYVTQQVDAVSAFRDEVFISTNKSFMWDETYALYISFVLNTGQETEAFHIPGRPHFNINLGNASDSARAENALVNSLGDTDDFNGGGDTDYSPGGQLYRINSNAKVFHAFNTADNPNAVNIYGTGQSSNMGYWENATEVYPNTSDWDILDENNILLGSLQGLPIMHHKMPHAQNSTSKMIVNQSSGTNYSQSNILGIKLKHISIPSIYLGKIISAKVYYAKRDINNRTILGQSLTIPQGGFHFGQNRLDGQKMMIDLPGNLVMYAIYNEAGDMGHVDHQFGVIPSYLMNTVSADNLYYANYNGDSFSKTNAGVNYAYYSFPSFDILHNNLSVNSATYVKNVFKLNTKYIADGGYGDCAANAAGHPVDYALYLFVNPSDYINNYFGLNNTLKEDSIRICRTKNYIPNNTPGYDTGTSIILNTFMPNYYNGGGELKVMLEYENELINMTGSDSAYINFLTTGNVASSLAGSTANSNFYLSNLCIFNSDIYNSFDNQELCYTGYEIPYTSFNPSVSQNIYGGDTFINYSCLRSTLDLGKWVDNSGNNRQHFELRCLHYYICQSDANINYRYSNIGIANDIYYPKNDDATVNGTDPLLDNWYGYNNDYSSVNDVRSTIPIHSKFTVNVADSIFQNRIIRSAKDNIGGNTDGYLDFLSNNFVDLDKQRGQIEVLKRSGDLLYIHLDKSITRTVAREVLKLDATTAYLGTGDIFTIPVKDIVYTDTGYGGTTAQWANIVTPFGYIYPDAESGKIFSMSQQIEDISANGMINFFNKNGKLLLREQLLRLKNVTFQYSDNPVSDVSSSTIKNSTIGFTACWDNKFRRYVLTKKDYLLRPEFESKFKGYLVVGPYNVGDIYYENEVINIGSPSSIVTPASLIIWNGSSFDQILVEDTTYFIDKSFTIAYYPEFKSWGSLYSYKPELYYSDQKDMYAYKKGVIYKHNDLTTFGTFYGITYPFVIDIVDNDTPEITKIFSSFTYASKFVDNLGNIDISKTFNAFQVYDSYQLSKLTNIVNRVSARLVNNLWDINQFRNLRNNYVNPILDPDYNIVGTVDPAMPYYQQERIFDKYAILRLTFDNTTTPGKLSLQENRTSMSPKIR